MITRETAKPRYETMQLELYFAEPVERLMDNLVEVAERRRRRRRTLMWLCALWSIIIVVEISLLFVAIWIGAIY